MLARLRIPHPRFSLLTLTLGVIFVGACGGLWWRWAPWVEARTFEYPLPAYTVGISPDGKTYFVYVHKIPMAGRSEREQAVYVYDARSGTQRFSRKPDNLPKPAADLVFTSVRYAPGGQYLIIEGLTRSKNLCFHVVDAETGDEPRLGRGRTWPVRNVRFSDDGRKMLYLTEDHAAAVLDLISGLDMELEVPAGLKLSESIAPCALSADGKTAFVGHGLRGYGVSVFATETGSQVRSLAGDMHSSLSVICSPDGKRALLQGNKEESRIYDVQTGQVVVRVATQLLGGAFSPDSQRLVLLGESDSTVLDANTGTVLLTIPGAETINCSRCPERFSRDGSKLFRWDDRVCLDARNGKKSWEFRGEEVCLSPDERRMLVYSTMGGPFLRLLDAETGNELSWPDKGPREMVFDPLTFAFSPDGAWVLSALGQKASIWVKRRPEYWWGIAWLPEFWIALLSGSALLIIAARHLRRRSAKLIASSFQSPVVDSE